MTGGRDVHARYRELLSDRLNGLLDGESSEELNAHLLPCARCRAVDREYRRARQQLRSWRAPPPPRDLWARTSAALDRSVMSQRRRAALTDPRSARGRALTVAALVGAGLSLAVVAAQLDGPLTPAPLAVPGGSGVRPTPFEIPSQELAFVSYEAGGLAVYQAAVQRVCPAPTVDCAEAEVPRRRVLHVPSELSPTEVALNGNGSRVAVTSRVRDAEAVYVLAVASGDRGPAPTDGPVASPTSGVPATLVAVASGAGSGDSGGVAEPTSGAEPSGAEPSGTGAEPGTGANPEPSSPPSRQSTAPSASSPTTPQPGESTPARTAEPRTEPPRATERPPSVPGASVEPSVPTESPATPEPSEPIAQEATASPTQVAASPTHVAGTAPSAQASQAPAGSSPPEPPDGAARDPEYRAIIEGIDVVGAPPSWSLDGSTLAFSAMPADGRTGPDLYLWRSGDERARRLTRDHGSYFASWSGERVVVSRVSRLGVGPEAQQVRTVVIDVTSGDERAVRVDDLWLPIVDPESRFAIGWRGQLDLSGTRADPVAGALYLFEWRRVDPFGSGRDRATPPPDELSEEPSAQLSEEPSAQPTGSPSENSSERTGEQPTDRAAQSSPANPEGSPLEPSEQGQGATAPSQDPAAKREGPAAEGAEGRESTEPTAPSEASSEPTESTGAAEVDLASRSEVGPPVGTEGDAAAPVAPETRLVPIDPGRDVSRDPVLDWQVHWDDRGRAFGFWVAESRDAEWGRLAVLGVEPSGAIDRDAALLTPTLARRAFTLGEDRVAFVAPAETDPEGELRIRTWGPAGPGSIRIRNLDDSVGAPAF